MNRSQIYDANVVGTGISGGWAARELCGKGSKTFVLERDRTIGHIKYHPSAYHGRAKMGHDPKPAVVNAHNLLYDVPNKAVADGAFMILCSCGDRSLTYMASPAKAAEHAADQLKKGLFS